MKVVQMRESTPHTHIHSFSSSSSLSSSEMSSEMCALRDARTCASEVRMRVDASSLRVCSDAALADVGGAAAMVG
jgi:hypothetical protein